MENVEQLSSFGFLVIIACVFICAFALIGISFSDNPASFDPIGAIKDKIAFAKWEKQMLKDMKELQEKLDADRVRNLKEWRADYDKGKGL